MDLEVDVVADLNAQDDDGPVSDLSDDEAVELLDMEKHPLGAGDASGFQPVQI